ncbi:4a-hydroxytetrahydrobiopterin dehydratase [Agrococcus carbonis]|uniref:Putative pterin-4-alpha-carbinolamine dehydratase n=1 Tax=Agrococcus carbonis TaxID=684552 RepID=A0A1H1LNJ0_9MICO|nr:4a-hydroxytetrahydrobiopterin dehydratase [Agrococcus carbonis]SDR76123.1 pterin-4-alpha-carbinolamine dehydratase [Agrococcus carbonis]
MSDPQQLLTQDQIDDAGLADWRRVGDALVARFRTKSFAKGLELVNRIGAAAEAADHHPDIALTYGAVGVTLSSHDAGGITVRDVRLARAVDEAAAALGIAAVRDR